MDHPKGAGKTDNVRLGFDRRVRLEFHGSKISSDGGLLLFRELDEVLGLHDIAGGLLRDTRTGRNRLHTLVGLLRQGSGVPPVKWSTNRDRIIPQFGGPENGWETREARRHRIETSTDRSAARTRHDGRGRVTPDRHYGADVLSVAQAIWRNEPRTAEAAQGA